MRTVGYIPEDKPKTKRKSSAEPPKENGGGEDASNV